jgi:hypothetical protein
MMNFDKFKIMWLKPDKYENILDQLPEGNWNG